MNLSKPVFLIAFAAEKSGLAKAAWSGYLFAAKSMDSHEAWFRLGRLAYQKGDWDKAAGFYAQAIRVAPDHAESHFKLGLCRIRRGQWREAEACIGTALKLEPWRAQWRAQYNDVLGKLGKNPTEWAEEIVEHVEPKDVCRLLAVQMLREDLAGFDSLHELADSSLRPREGREAARFIVLEAARHAASGDAAALAALMAGLDAELPANALLAGWSRHIEGDHAGCVDHLQEFLAEFPGDTSACLLMARAARLSGHPEIAWRTLDPLLADEARSAVWNEASLLVRDRSDFNRLFGYWRKFKKIYKITPYYVKVASHVAAAAARAGNRDFALRLLSECALNSSKRGIGPPADVFSPLNHPEYPNLPDDDSLLDGVSVKAIESTAERGLTAIAAFSTLMEEAEIRHCAIRRTLFRLVPGQRAPDLDDTLEFGVFGEASLSRIYGLLEKKPAFAVSRQPAPEDRVIRFKHANHMEIAVFLHRESAGSLAHGTDGVEWTQPVFAIGGVECRGRRVPVPADIPAYLAAFFSDTSDGSRELDYLTAARNAMILEQGALSLRLRHLMLERAMLGDNDAVLRCAHKLSELGERDFVRKYFGENSNYLDANLPQLLIDKPQVVLYLSGLENVAYQGNMWIPVLEKLPVRCAIVIRERRIASQLLPTKLPVYYFESLRDLEYLEEAGVRTILYPANSQKATQSLRLHRLNHFFINHGESDKVVNQSKFLMAYDKLLVAGPLAERRLRDAGLPVRDEQVIHVGRPQTELFLKRADAPATSVKTIFYAPTWEGFNEEANYSSVDSYGLQMLEALASCPQFRVWFKPHPYTGQSNPNVAGAYLKKMTQVARRSQIKLIDAKESVFDCMNASDLLITDVSSVLNDYLHTLKPMVLTNPKRLAREEIERCSPSSRATYVLDDPREIARLIGEIERDDHLFDRRREVCADSLGEFPNGSLAEFAKVVVQSVEEEAERAAASVSQCGFGHESANQ